MHGAIQASCPSCGAGFPVAAQSAVVRCPHCGHEYHARQVEAAAAYQRQAQSQQHAIQTHRQVAASIQKWEAPQIRGMGCVLSALPFAIGAVVVAHEFGSLLLPEAVATHLPGILGGAAVLALIVGTIVAGRRKESAAQGSQPVGAAVTVGCPTCGAPAVLSYGEQVGACPYCSSALVPGAETQAALLEAGRVAEWHAKLEQVRQQRYIMVRANAAGSGGTPWIIMVVMSTLPMIGMQSFIMPMFSTVDPILLTTYLGGWAVLLGSVALWSVLKLRRQAKLNAIEQALADIALQYGGHSSRGFANALAWLDNCWCDALDHQWIGDHPSCGYVHARLLGFRCYADVFPEAPNIIHKARAMVLVAAVSPATGFYGKDRLQEPALQPYVQAITKLGFQIEINDGGVQAVGAGDRYWTVPAQIRELASVMYNSCCLALALGASVPPHD